MPSMTEPRTLRSAVYGAAVGDALGVPYEFCERGTFECLGMTDGGAHRQPLGTFSDDTSLLLATCDSIRANGGRIDTDDMRARFVDWMRNGAYTPDGVMFDIGNATATALIRGYGCAGGRDNGNGSLMRIAPLAFTSATDDEVRAVSAITHAHAVSTECCVTFIAVLRRIIAGASIDAATAGVTIAGDPFDPARPDNPFDPAKPRDEVRSGGYVRDTLDAALWCLANTDTYIDCVLTAVNLGSDTDTTACVAGALAGAFYGFEAIPPAWVEALRGKDTIERCLF